MTFWDTVWAAFIAGLLVVAAAAIIARAWKRLRAPRIILRDYGSTHARGEPWLRWYHAEVFCDSDAVALHPEVRVWPPDGAGFEVWNWAGPARPEAIRRTSLLVPIVLGNLEGTSHWLSDGTAVDPHAWYLTPEGRHPIGRRFDFTADATLVFKVQVSWLGQGQQHHRDAEFRLTFRAPGTEPSFGMIGPSRWQAVPRIMRPRARR